MNVILNECTPDSCPSWYSNFESSHLFEKTHWPPRHRAKCDGFYVRCARICAVQIEIMHFDTLRLGRPSAPNIETPLSGCFWIKCECGVVGIGCQHYKKNEIKITMRICDAGSDQFEWTFALTRNTRTGMLSAGICLFAKIEMKMKSKN